MSIAVRCLITDSGMGVFRMKNIFIGLLLVVLGSQIWAQEQVDGEIAPEAVELLKAMIDHLGKTDAFLLRAESGYDVLQDNGQMLEFGGRRTVLVDKPDRARFDLIRRDGFKASLILDGERLWYVTPNEKAYGSLKQPGNLDESLDFAEQKLGLSQQLADFVGLEPYAGLAKGLKSAAVVGKTEIQGVPCTHAAYRNDIADFQIWVASNGQPVMRRLVITYRDDPGQPQFWAQVAEFDQTPEIDSESFSFDPPEGFSRQTFLVPAVDTDADLK